MIGCKSLGEMHCGGQMHGNGACLSKGVREKKTSQNESNDIAYFRRRSFSSTRHKKEMVRPILDDGADVGIAEAMI